MSLDDTQTAIVSVLTAVIGLAIVAILVSRQSATAGVIGAAASGFGSILQVAVSPVTGGSPYAGPGASQSQVFSPGNNNGINLPGVISNLSGAINAIQGIFN